MHAAPVQPQAQHVAEHYIVSDATQEPLSEPEAKFAGPLPNNRSPEMNPTFKVEPPSQQQGFVVDVPPVNADPGTPSTTTEVTPSPSTVPAVTSKSPSLEEEDPPSPTESELGRKDKEAETGEDGTATVNGKPVQSSQEIFEEHKRKQLMRDMEEKIAINPTEPEILEPRRRRDDDAPMMSATSYPGQEWNPFGAEGWVEDDI